LVVWFIVAAIVRALFRRKEKTVSKLTLKKPPVLIWKAGDPGTEIAHHPAEA